MPLAHLRRSRRALSAILTAVFAAAALLVCMPVPAVASEPGHCAPRDDAPKPQHPCDLPIKAMDCCVGAPQLPAVPAATPDAGRIEGAAALAVPQPGLVSHGLVTADASALRAAPLHGHRHIDLPTLNAAFLI
jgi:hypothetical protein